jgi:hypothetical protein
VTLRPDHQDEPAPDWTDRDESIFRHGMLVVKDLEVIHTRLEQVARFEEPDAMLPLIRPVLCRVPLDLHNGSVRIGAGKSMAYPQTGESVALRALCAPHAGSGRRLGTIRIHCVKRIPLLLVLLAALVSCNGESPTSPLDRSATLSGVVTDRYGNVWGGVSIGLVQAEGVVASGSTNGEGRYSIRGVRPGQYKVWLQLGRTGPGGFVGDIALHEGQNSFDIVSP